MDFIRQGRVYRAKVPRCVDRGEYVNDRVVLRVNMVGGDVQYDGPAVANGRKYPRCTLAAFREWAGSDVTDIMPPGEWQRWPLPPVPDVGGTVTGRMVAGFTPPMHELPAK